MLELYLSEWLPLAACELYAVLLDHLLYENGFRVGLKD
jgi:hypothetical protein